MKIELTELAAENRTRILDYITTEFSIDVSEAINEAIANALELISTLPAHWPKIRTRRFGTVRKAVVNSRTIILYKIEKDRILVVNILDARSNWLQ